MKDTQPWYRQFWPWFIIALPASVVVASFITFWLAVSTDDPMVITNDDYQELRSDLRAQDREQGHDSNSEKEHGSGP